MDKVIELKWINNHDFYCLHFFIGKYFWANGEVFEGEWKVGTFNGQGKIYDQSGKVREQGTYKDGKFIRNNDWIKKYERFMCVCVYFDDFYLSNLMTTPLVKLFG